MCPSSTLNPPAHRPGNLGGTYVSAPITVSRAPGWEETLERVRQRYPESPVLTPTTLFRSRLDWRTRIPVVLRHADRMVFLTTPDGFIGKGVLHEVTVALTLAKPIEMLTAGGDLVAYEDLDIGPPDEADWVRHFM